MMRIALAQRDFPVGDLPGNLRRVMACVAEARERGAALAVLPELALTGYPPEDLLLRPGFVRRARECFEQLLGQVRGIDVLVGHPWAEDGRLYNAASWMRDGRVIGRYAKQCLPNYAVFDERRYFAPGGGALVVELGGCRMGVILCEDAWEPGPAARAHAAGAELLLIPNASPYRDDKLAARSRMLQSRHAETGLPVAYCNLVGGQDELVFDGRSMLLDAAGTIRATGPLCEEALLVAAFDPDQGRWDPEAWPPKPPEGKAEIYRVLVRGLADYAHKNGFSDAVLGLSGGVDSALTLAVCADALGPERVHAVMMPSPYTSQLSLDLAAEQARRMQVEYLVIPVTSPLEAMQAALAPAIGESPAGVTHENLQARIRGSIIMALSNQHGWLPVATSNKSELAVGYSTLYGDMCGGFAPLKDCLKTRVYELARYRNGVAEVIPPGVLSRAPSAELKPGQTDQDSLPDYATLDAILLRFVDLDRSIHEIVAEGYDEATVRRVAAMVLRSEYKRRQGAPGVRITSRGFGRDRRYPITSLWREDAGGS
jgi:NAD+ synthase (glutamine-hydrolysing)